MREAENNKPEVERQYADTLAALGRAIRDLDGGRLRNPASVEYWFHGVARRLRILERSIENVFSIFPPSRLEVLERDARADVSINLHVFLINVHGVLDNLAWILVHERQIVLRPVQIGLFLPTMRPLLPQRLSSYLFSPPICDWHTAYAKRFRDALAHRIPAYVPVYEVTDKAEYERLEQRTTELAAVGDWDAVATTQAAQAALTQAAPFFRHSLSEPDAQHWVPLHAQVILDAKTVLEIRERVILELEAAPA